MHVVVARIPVSISQEYRELYVLNLVKLKATHTEKCVEKLDLHSAIGFAFAIK